MSSVSDHDLVRQILAGNKDAYALVVQNHGQKIYSFVCRMVREPDLSRDLAQEVFVRAYTRLNTFDGSKALGPWLYKIALNLVRDHFRKNKDIALRSISHEEISVRVECSPEEFWMAREKQMLLQQAMCQLPPDLGEALALRFFQDMSFEEMARILGVSQSAAKMRVYRGLEKMVDILEGEEG